MDIFPLKSSLEYSLKDVTFIVTVRGRCKHLRRALEYYSNFPVNVLVMDASDRPCRTPVRPAQYRAVHLPQTFLIDAMVQAISVVKTKYCVIASDDDFFIPGAIARLAQFLDEHPDYQCALGHYGRFLNAGMVTLSECYPHMPGVRVIAEKPENRMIEHLSHYVTQYHGLHRTEPLLDTIRSSYPVTNFSVNEITCACLMAIAGKSAVLPVLFCVREHILTAQSGLNMNDKANPKISTVLAEPEAHQQLLGAMEKVVLEALARRGVSQEDGLKSLRQALDAYRNFSQDYKAIAQSWQENIAARNIPSFSDIVGTEEVQKEWKLILSTVRKHDLDPLVWPLFVDSRGRTVCNLRYIIQTFLPAKFSSTLKRWRTKLTER